MIIVCKEKSAVSGASDWIQGRQFEIQLGYVTFKEIDHEIISAIFLMKSLLPSFSHFCWIMKGCCQLLVKVYAKVLRPVVQSIASWTSLLRVISLIVLADSIYNIMIFFAEKMWVAFALQKLLTFFQQKISAYLRIT